MLTNSSRFLRAASGRMDDPRTSARLRRMSTRRLRGARIVATSPSTPDTAAGERLPGDNLLAALASPRRSDVLNALVGHERQLLHVLTEAVATMPLGRRRRAVKRVRDGVERDVARMHTLLRGGHRSESRHHPHVPGLDSTTE
jgi:hypothetical protein